MTAESAIQLGREADAIAALGADRLSPDEEAVLRRTRRAAERGRSPGPRDREALDRLRRRFARELAELRSADAE